MCYLNLQQCAAADGALAEFLEAGEPFTGWEVHQALKASWAELSPWRLPVSKHTSSYVRERFNLGKMPGWAATKANEDPASPVVYFKVYPSSKGGRKCKAVTEAMSSP